MTVPPPPSPPRYDQKAFHPRATSASGQKGKSRQTAGRKEPRSDGNMKNGHSLQPPRAATWRSCGGSGTALIAAAAVALAAVGIFAQLAGEVRYLRTLYEDARDQIDRLRSEVNAYKFDSLTGLATRRDFSKLLKTLWSRWVRRGQPFTFAMVDLDNLHAINRRFGFQSGDGFIRSVAVELQRSCGGGGAAFGSGLGGNGTNVFRIGGDEFAVLTPGDDVAALSQRLAAMRGVQYYAVASSDAAAASLRRSSEFFDLVDRGLIGRKKGRRDTWWPETPPLPTPSARPAAANAWQSAAAAAASSASQARKKGGGIPSLEEGRVGG